MVYINGMYKTFLFSRSSNSIGSADSFKLIENASEYYVSIKLHSNHPNKKDKKLSFPNSRVWLWLVPRRYSVFPHLHKVVVSVRKSVFFDIEFITLRHVVRLLKLTYLVQIEGWIRTM